MQITVTFRHMDSTQALKRHATEKLSHLEHYYDQLMDMQVVFSTEKKDHICEVTLHSPGEVFKATAKTDDMYSAIDAVMGKLERHAVKRKEITKMASHKSTRPVLTE